MPIRQRRVSQDAKQNLVPVNGGMVATADAQMAALAAGVEGLRTDVQALTQGLLQMVETQDTHSEMLRQILGAATQPPPAENPLETLLAQVVVRLGEQTAALEQIGDALGRLPSDMEKAVVRGVRLAVDDGVAENE